MLILHHQLLPVTTETFMTETFMMQRLEELNYLSYKEMTVLTQVFFFLSKTNWIQSETYLRFCTKGFDRSKDLFLSAVCPATRDLCWDTVS